MRKPLRTVIGVVVVIALLGLFFGKPIVTYLAIRAAPEKTPLHSTTELARTAKASFWNGFQSNNYDSIPGVIRQLTAAYLEDPRDPEVTLLLAHAHLWRIAESGRQKDPGPTITDDMILAEKFFEQALHLRPRDYRILGWLGSARMALGSIHQDERLTREGYFMLQESVEKFPEFNHFTIGFVMSSLPRTDRRYQDALDNMWEALDACFGKTDRGRPAPPDRALFTTQGPKRVCANSPLAPHNLEGFMLNMGDMLVKAGEPDVAKIVYANARASETFESWPYRNLLEQRIASADERAAVFNSLKPGDPEPEMMIHSSYGCTGCHAR